jgi:hypothetical protein
MTSIATSLGTSESRFLVKKKSHVSERIGSSLTLVEDGFRQLLCDLDQVFVEAGVVIRRGRQP